MRKVMLLLSLILLISCSELPTGVHQDLPMVLAPDGMTLDQQVKLIADTGVKVVRISASWSDIEPTNDNWNWDSLDDIITTLESYGLEVLIILIDTPGWAGECEECPPTSQAEWGEFVFEIVNRYQGRVWAWEVWNEPNSNAFWQGTVDEYYTLLVTASTKINEARPSAKIVLGSMTHSAVLNRGAWIRSLLNKPDLGDYFDVFGFHLYGVVGTPEDTFASLKILLAGYQKEIWVTETNPQKENETDQADAVEDWYRRIFGEGATMVFWFTMVNFCQEQTSLKTWCDANVYNTSRRSGGLLYLTDFSKTEVYSAMQRLMAVSP